MDSAGLRCGALATDDAGAATLYRRTSHTSDHRNGDTVKTRLLVRIPVQVAAAPIADAGVRLIMTVATTRDALLVAKNGDRVWREHNDHIRTAIRAHEYQLAHLHDDLKAERRRPARERKGIVERMGMFAERQHQRMRSWLHEAAAHVVGYAQRQHCSVIEYDASDHRFCDPFPWFELRMRLAEKCEVAGIEFRLLASGEEMAETPEPPEEANIQ